MYSSTHIGPFGTSTITRSPGHFGTVVDPLVGPVATHLPLAAPLAGPVATHVGPFGSAVTSFSPGRSYSTTHYGGLGYSSTYVGPYGVSRTIRSPGRRVTTHSSAFGTSTTETLY